MSENNMRIWDLVSKSDPDTVKEVSYGKRKFHTVAAQSQVKKATEIWGPMGEGWGVKDEDYQIVAFGNHEVMCLYTAKLWYHTQDIAKYAETCISSSIMVAEFDRHGNFKKDDEFAKKVSTDALTKGLSRLGFNSDIFEGLFDDNRYQAYLHAEKQQMTVQPVQQQPQAAAFGQPVQQPQASMPSDVDSFIQRMNAAFELPALQEIGAEIQAKTNDIQNMFTPEELGRLNQAYTDATNRLSGFNMVGNV